MYYSGRPVRPAGHDDQWISTIVNADTGDLIPTGSAHATESEAVLHGLVIAAEWNGSQRSWWQTLFSQQTRTLFGLACGFGVYAGILKPLLMPHIQASAYDPALVCLLAAVGCALADAVRRRRGVRIKRLSPTSNHSERS